MKKSLICLFILHLFAYPIIAGEVPADTLAKWIKIGDILAKKWDHKGAAEIYQKVLKYDPTNYEALWKAGDELTEFADDMPKDLSVSKEFNFNNAAVYCRKAIEVEPEGYEGYFYLSVALGRLALYKGGKEKINMSREIKEMADKAIELNPEADLAHHVLGRWQQNLANLSGMLKFFAKILYGGVPPGSNEEAVVHFQKAIELNPTHIEHHLELGRTYKFMSQPELMLESLEIVKKLPAVEEDDKWFKKEAEEMMKKVKIKKKQVAGS